MIQPYSCCSLDIFRDDVGNVAASKALSDQFWGDDLASGDDGLANALANALADGLAGALGSLLVGLELFEGGTLPFSSSRGSTAR